MQRREALHYSDRWKLEAMTAVDLNNMHLLNEVTGVVL